MKKNKLMIFPILTVVVLLALVATFVLGGGGKAKPADGKNGVLFADYFTENTASDKWMNDFNSSVTAPQTVQDSLKFAGTGLKPCATMLGYELPNKFDIYFTADIKEQGGDSRDSGIFFCVGEDYEERYQVLISEEKIQLKYNGTTDIVVKKVENLKSGQAHAFRISVQGAKLQVFLDEAEEPSLKFVAPEDFESFLNARTLGVFSYAKEFYFDNLVITNGEDLIPIQEVKIAGKENKEVIEGLENSLQMEMFLNPSGTTDSALVWSVDDSQIAEITSDGLLTAKGYGTVTVSARTRDGSKLSASKTIDIRFGEKGNQQEILHTNRSAVLTESYSTVFEGQEPDVYVLDSGRILVSAEVSGKAYSGHVAYSDDNGKTWKTVLESGFRSGRVFEVEDKVYLIGEDSGNSNLIIYVSEDEGENWSTKYVLDSRKWSSAPSEVLVENDCVYLTMEVESQAAVSKGYTGNAALSPILLKASVESDLTDKANWSFSSELAYADVITNGAANAVDYVDLPNSHGDKSSVGWAAGNVFQMYDKKQMWYDETMRSFYIYLHGSEGTQNYALLLKISEDKKGNMTPSLVKTSKTNKNLLFVPMPGGNEKFNLVYDSETELYWQVSNYMHDDNRVALYFSKNAYDWAFAGIVAKTENGSCDSPSIVIDGADALVAIHQEVEGNSQVALYRVENLCSLAY